MATEVLYIRYAYIAHRGQMIRSELHYRLNVDQSGLRVFQPVMMVGYSYRTHGRYVMHVYSQQAGLN